ncbi:MAG TPA: cation transporter, partial [Chitinophagales bacterium]|nr:cation transporter [Chitinophagales bacterium]
TWNLLTDSMKLSLDGVPNNVQLEDIKKTALGINGILNIHHLHVWAISTTENALTAHILLSNEVSIEEEQHIKHELKHQLQHQNIHHITIETEREAYGCDEVDC